jgi:hypothetical protein
MLLSEDVLGVTRAEVFWIAVGCQAVDLRMRKIAAPRKDLESVAVTPRFREGRTVGPPAVR